MMGKTPGSGEWDRLKAQMVQGEKRVRRTDPIGEVTCEWRDGAAYHVVKIRLSSPMIGHLIAKAHELHQTDVDDGVVQ